MSPAECDEMTVERFRLWNTVLERIEVVHGKGGQPAAQVGG